ncbi:MAG: ImmA/IrrE family metallo-endopeptidase [Patescibacteria group bacterium]|nr:ImmA/IrrE family metallo-endopeptidase [Patescibacteria group bacterium]
MEEQNNKPRIVFARQTARELLADANIKNHPVLIRDVINYIKKGKDVSVYPWAFGNNIDGIQIMESEKATIGYNQTQHPHRQRFTVAHEIGHLLLGHTKKNFILDLNSKNPEEIEANQFAAELLIPLEMLKKDLQNKKNAKDIAREYNVSEEAVWWRLYDCKLITRI